LPGYVVHKHLVPISIPQTFELLEQPRLTRMRTITMLVLVALVSVQANAQSAVSVTVVKAGRLLDPRTGKVLAPVAVLIEDNKIKRLGEPS
jgi:hypothetical protein